MAQGQREIKPIIIAVEKDDLAVLPSANAPSDAKAAKDKDIKAVPGIGQPDADEAADPEA